MSKKEVVETSSVVELNEARPALKFQRVKTVVRQQLKLIEEVPVFIEVQGAFYKGEQDKNELLKPEKDRKEPPTLVDAIDLETGEEVVVVANKGVVDGIERAYADGTYVGKRFEICIHGKKTAKNGNQFRPVSLFELA